MISKGKGKTQGQIIIPAGVNPWAHELNVAKILALDGHNVKFIAETNIKTPDIYLDGIEFEIKCPITSDPKKVVRNVKRALEKCPNVIICSSRIKQLRDDKIQNILKNKIKDLRTLKKLIFINKKGQIIDISSLI